MEPKKEEVGVRLDDGLQERVGAYAGREGLTVGEAVSALLYLGLEFAERQRTGLKEDVEDLQRELRDLRQMVGVLGPAALGAQRILAHWAAQTGGLRVSVRSFRAPDLVERGLKDLARSRIDTTREVVFQPLGARFLEAREDPARIGRSSERTRSTRRKATSRGWCCGSSLSSRRGSWPSSLAPSNGGSRRPRVTRSCASSRAPRASTWRASSRPPAGTSSWSHTST